MKKRIISLILALVMAFGLLPVTAKAELIPAGLQYEVLEDHVEITRSLVLSDHIEIPDPYPHARFFISEYPAQYHHPGNCHHHRNMGVQRLHKSFHHLLSGQSSPVDRADRIFRCHRYRLLLSRQRWPDGI